MTDSHLRDLERRYQQTGAKDDELAYDAARVRAGEAIETGFLERLREPAGEQVFYKNRARVHLGQGVVRDVALHQVVGKGSRTVDVECAGGLLHVLAVHHSVRKHFFIDAAGRVDVVIQSKQGSGSITYGLVKVDGEVGYGEYVGEFMQQTRISLNGSQNVSEGTLFGFERKYGYLSLHRLRESEITRGQRLVVFCDSALVSGANGVPPIEGVVVQDGVVHCANEIAARAGAFVQSGELLLLPQSRFVTGRYVAPDADSLEKYHRIAGFRRVYRALQEVPKKNLEGLLIAVERAGHKKKKGK